MQGKSLFQTITVVLLLLFCVGITIAHSYMLEKRDYNIIKMAYMNGSVDALKLDIETIKNLKSDEEHFKSLVYAAADSYLKRVETLSAKRVVKINHRGGIYIENSRVIKKSGLW